MMKRIPMILLLSAPYLILFAYYQTPMDVTIPLCIYGVFLIFNMVYAFLLPKLGFNGKQILFWNLLLKLSHIPLHILILLFTVVMAMVGGTGLQGEVLTVFLTGSGCGFVLRLSAAMFGISGFRWCHKYGTLSKAGMIVSSVAQLIPGVDVIGSILCYIMFRKEGQADIALASTTVKGENYEYF